MPRIDLLLPSREGEKAKGLGAVWDAASSVWYVPDGIDPLPFLDWIDRDSILPPFPAYMGEEPYIFVSYSHRDKAAVYFEIERLVKLGYRVWYDEGIPAGSSWRSELVRSIERCRQMLVFLSHNAVASENIANEVVMARQLKPQKPLIKVMLGETNLEGDMLYEIGRLQSILKHKETPDRYHAQLERALLPETKGLNRTDTATKAASPPQPPYLSLTVGEHVQFFPILKGISHLGREVDNQMVIFDSTISHRHARFQYSNKGVLLTDLDSTNGTTVDGEKIVEQWLGSIAEIEFGGVSCVYYGVSFVNSPGLVKVTSNPYRRVTKSLGPAVAPRSSPPRSSSTVIETTQPLKPPQSSPIKESRETWLESVKKKKGKGK